MSRLTDLISLAGKENPQLGKDLASEIKALMNRRSFGLVFERHQPEAVELAKQAVRRGNKVRILPPRGQKDTPHSTLYRVEAIESKGSERTATLIEADAETPEVVTAPVSDLVVVAQFDDKIYPGLEETGRVERGGDKPYHTVINGENYHVLQMLTYTHRHKIDAIYIDPPYNTGAKDWKYNNDYVEGDDAYRHSKWLAMMERRLLIARELLNPADSVLICTIDEKEYLRLGLLLEQVFPEANIQMVSSEISRTGMARDNQFRRSDEYLYFVQFGRSAPQPLSLGAEWLKDKKTSTGTIRWSGLMRSGTNAARSDRPGMFYPIFVDADTGLFRGVGEALPIGESRDSVLPPENTLAIWPIRSDGSEGRWQIGPDNAVKLSKLGYLKVGRLNGAKTAIAYLKTGEQKKVREGVFGVATMSENGIQVETGAGSHRSVPTTQWSILAHSASEYGSTLLRSFLPSRRFPFPKSLYAVEDTLRFFVKNKPNAIVLDFFAGSGTTTHAVMRLNKQDGGQRQCICVTNNEVSDDEQRKLRKAGLRPGDRDWEEWGICDYITKPRITAAITGVTPDGQPIKGNYKFIDEFPMSDGLAENAAFFTLTYEAPLSVRHHRAFDRIAPMLWLRAGARGPILDEVIEYGWALSDVYGVLADVDCAEGFLSELENHPDVGAVFIVTDDDAAYQLVAQDLPDNVEPVRLYESYLTNFEIMAGRN
ncbi:DNA (cytosine-5-)-methyltransferase [Varibaculum cambriense]|uniref:DNA (Cytosine-5-)-methyltransferase n=1 Tax=Varibaculum cambriense TaxID=184870 RepID=A0AB34WZ69_9ACTO|nr:DNA methyltransferase [Varibaculum cambriense]KXB80670.1 DNA (cytosine-5-)-methyltransferase [Varibaculum cambriense]